MGKITESQLSEALSAKITSGSGVTIEAFNKHIEVGSTSAHTIANITNLQSTLDSKASISGTANNVFSIGYGRASRCDIQKAVNDVGDYGTYIIDRIQTNAYARLLVSAGSSDVYLERFDSSGAAIFGTFFYNPNNILALETAPTGALVNNYQVQVYS